MQTKILGVILVVFYILDKLLIRYFAFVRYWRKMGVQWGYTSAICSLQKGQFPVA
jgi:hypothetical protein